jgi:hypothetical protein
VAYCNILYGEGEENITYRNVVRKTKSKSPGGTLGIGRDYGTSQLGSRAVKH